MTAWKGDVLGLRPPFEFFERSMVLLSALDLIVLEILLPKKRQGKKFREERNEGCL